MASFERTKKKAVVKIGSADTIRKEYRIGDVIKDIPGFIHFICLMTCNDNLTRYKVDRNSMICSNNPNDRLKNVLVMPLIPLGSFRKYSWHNNDVNQFKHCMKQLFMSLYFAFMKHGFLHTDIHLDNVLLKRTRKQFITYGEDNIPTSGLEVCIMDFENAFMPIDINQTHLFFQDIARIIYDIRLTMMLRFNTFQALEMHINKCMSADIQIDIKTLLSFVDGIQSIEKEEIKVLQYNPNVF